MKSWKVSVWSSIAVVVLLCVGGLPAAAQTGVAPQETLAGQEGSWVTIMTEGFEGTWPTGSWSAFDGNGQTGGEVYWDEDDFKPHTGTKSNWCANGGADGRDPQYYYYPNYMDSWAVYGPFSLADATEAELQFWVWNASEPGYDYFKWLASKDCVNYYGYKMSVPTDGWDQWTFDLSNVPTIGDLTGDSSVCIAFKFTSDYGITNVGAFVDDLTLKKYVGANCYALTTSVSPTGSGTVTADPPPNCGNLYTAGTSVTLTAVPNAGYDFYHWTGDASGTDNPLIVAMNGNLSITANFSPLCYPLTLNHTGSGLDPTANPTYSIGCSAGQYHAGETINLTAYPDPGWILDSWTGSNGPHDPTLTMPAGAHTVTANYVVPSTAVKAGTATVQPGDHAVVPLDLLNTTGALLGAVTIDVYFDPAVVDATACAADPGGVFDWAFCNVNYAANAIRLTAISAEGVSGDALLANMTFLAIGTLGQFSPLDVSLYTFNDPDGIPVPATDIDGQVKIGGADGDVDCSGATDVTDAMFVLQYVVGLRPYESLTCPLPPDSIYIPACDVSGDGNCEVTDALFILQCEVGIPNPFCPATGGEGGQGWPPPKAAASLGLGAEQRSADGAVTVPIWLALGDQALGAAAVRLELDPSVYQLEACVADPAGVMSAALCRVDAASGRVRLSALAAGGVSGDLALAEVTYRVLEGAPRDTATVLTVQALVDPAGRPIPASVRFGIVD